MAKETAIVLNNGSINSAVVTALATQKYRPIMLFADRGTSPDATSDGPPRSRSSFEQQAVHFKPYREHILAMPYLQHFKSTGGGKGSITGTSSGQSRTPTAAVAIELLPIMAAAARFAAHHEAVAIYLGLRVGPGAEQLAQATEYVQIWTELLNLPCELPGIDFQAPLLELEPWQVVDLGFQVGAPFERTWSCDEAGSEPCWSCRGCRAREAAFQQAAKPDPLRPARK